MGTRRKKARAITIRFVMLLVIAGLDASTFVAPASWSAGGVASAADQSCPDAEESTNEAFDFWRNSWGYNSHLVKKKLRTIGIARVHDAMSTYTWYWVTTFGSVVKYRRPAKRTNKSLGLE